MTVGVDFDGVIHGYSRGWADGTIYDPPIPGALEGLRQLMEHHAVFIFTARSPRQIVPWLEGHGFDATSDERCGRCLGVLSLPASCPPCRGTGAVSFWNKRGQLLVTRRKLPASAYLDDRAIRFTTWEAALDQLVGEG